MASPEYLLLGWLGERFRSLAAETIARPIVVPYDQLAGIDGWLLTLRNDRDVPGAVSLPGVTPSMVEPGTLISTAMLIASDYAVRRGAHDAASARCLLARECPVAIVESGPLDDARDALLKLAEAAGVPILREPIADLGELRSRVFSFGLRSTAHAAETARRHDPAFTFQTIIVEESIGGNSLSSFLVHNEGERDGVTVTGDMSPRISIEIGLFGDGVTVECTAELEQFAATIPSFLEGVHSGLDGESLRIGWRAGDAPAALEIGEVMRVWLKGMTSTAGVDVRLAFAPPRGRSKVLSEKRARAAAFRRYRAAVIADLSDPVAAMNTPPLDGSD